MVSMGFPATPQTSDPHRVKRIIAMSTTSKVQDSMRLSKIVNSRLSAAPTCIGLCAGVQYDMDQAAAAQPTGPPPPRPQTPTGCSCLPQ